MNYETLISFSGAVALLAISPGPDILFVMVQSLVNGKSYGLATIAGLKTGSLVHTSLVAFGVSAIIKSNPGLFVGIKIFGACYLLFLAYKVFKSGPQLELKNNQQVQERSHWQLYKQGLFMNLLNPKVTLFFLALFPSFLFSDSMGKVAQFYILGALFIAVSFVVFASVALLSGSISNYLNKHKKSGIWLKWMQVVVFVGIAVFILL